MKQEVKNQETKLNDSTKIFLLIFSIFALAAIIIGIVYACVGYSKKAYTNAYPSTAKVGYYAETLGTVERQQPEVKNEGLNARYPIYGYSLSNITAEEKSALITESVRLCGNSTHNNSGGGTYDQMDAEGYLYLNGTKLSDENGGYRKLYKHTAADSEHLMYFGEVSDDEPRLVKRITYTVRGAGYQLTGLYAPAGEVIKIEISKEDFDAIGGLYVLIGQSLYNRQANNIWTARSDFCRMPVILNTMLVNSNTATFNEKTGMYTCYVGSFFGGPIYIQAGKGKGTTFSTTITGGVNYPHFILGYTTEEEYNEVKKSSAPYFDLEVWDRGVLHSGPRKYAESFSYTDLYNAAILWEKISLVSTSFPSASSTNVGIVFLYEPFVAAGAAVAFPGRNSVNCPTSWMANSLNYNSFVASGAWGNVHEYNHHFQANWGRGNGGEVTNNAVSLVEYSLFTKISQARTQGNSGESGLNGWNRYTSASWATDQITAGKKENGLSEYATLLHNLGQDNFIKAAQAQRGGRDYANYYKALVNTTHYDFTYYFNTLLNAGLSEDITSTVSELNYPMFVPVASIFQTGRSITYDGEVSYTNTVQPYIIEYGQSFEFNLERYNTRAVNSAKNPLGYDVNLHGGLVLPDGFNYKVKNISQPQYGSIKQTSENNYIYTPVKSHIDSGKIYVKLQITKDDGAFNVDDVTLILEFKQKISSPNKIEQTTYSYSAEKMFDSVENAIISNFEGYSSKTDSYVNYPSKGLNGNAQVWFQSENTVNVLNGKLIINETGKYRLGLRGTYANLYVSLNGGKSYLLAANTKDYVANFLTEPAEDSGLKYHSDYYFEKDEEVYFKIVVINNSQVPDNRSYADLGMGLWSVPDVEINEDTNIEDLVPEDETVTVRTVTTAYVCDYEPEKGIFETDYFYSKNYSVSSTINDYADAQNEVIVISNSPTDSTYVIENAFDNNFNKGVVSASNAISETNPFEFVADIGENISVNSFILYGANWKGVNCTPTNFVLYGGTKIDNLKKIGEFTNLKISNNRATGTFPQTTFRYFKMVITDTYSHTFAAFCGLKFADTFTGKQISPDNEILKYSSKNWNIKTAVCTFGHIYEGKNAMVNFKFYGTRFAIYSLKSPDYKSFEVFIDGAKVDTVSLKSNEITNAQIVYTSNELEEGEHEISIRSKHAYNIDSIAITSAEAKPAKMGADVIVLIVIMALLMASVVAITVFSLCPQAYEGIKNVFKGKTASKTKTTKTYAKAEPKQSNTSANQVASVATKKQTTKTATQNTTTKSKTNKTNATSKSKTKNNKE